MKKQLLFGALLLGSIISVNAQDTCDTALELYDGTNTVDAITGDYLTVANGGCWGTGSASPNANWYYITPDVNAMIRINTNLAANVAPFSSTDTRVSVFTGDCGALECYAFSDDVNANAGPFLTDFSFAAAAGQTYYVAFDDRWSALGFDVEVTITPTSCFEVEAFGYAEDPTTTVVAIEWAEPIGSPTGYFFEYGTIGFEPGTGISETVTTTDIVLEGLAPSTEYEFYITTICGTGNQTEAVGPIRFSTAFEPATLPYSYGFETPLLGGWSAMSVNPTTGPWDTMTDVVTAWSPQEGEVAMAAGAYGANMDTWLFSRPVNLTANQVTTITYYLRKRAGAGAGGTNNVVVTIGADATAATQTTTLNTHNAFATTDSWVMQTATFTPTTSGAFVLGFHYTGPAQAQGNFGWLTLDNVTVTSTAGVNENLTSELSVFPNPAMNVINVVNDKGILVDGIQIVDLNGRTVKSAKFAGVTEAQVNISDLANGIYMMTVSSDKGTMTQKIVKN